MSDEPVFLRILQPTAIVVYLAMEHLSRGENNVPFEATASRISQLTGLSMPTVRLGRRDLIHARIVEELDAPKAMYMIPKSFARFWGESREALDSKRVSKTRRAPQKGGPGGKKSKILKTTLTDRAEGVRAAARILGTPALGGRYAAQAQKSLYGLVEHDGFELDDLLEVARHCRARYDGGERFAKLLNLTYIWSARNFTSYLTSARTTKPAGPRPYNPLGETPEQMQESDRANRERLRKLGLLGE
jgi:hypothetical protein